MAFYVSTFLNLGDRYRKEIIEYHPDKLFTFFGYPKNKNKLKKISLKLQSISKIGYLHTKIFNKNGFFKNFSRLGYIWTEEETMVYTTDYRYILELKKYYFKGKCKQIKRKKLQGKTQLKTKKEVFDIIYKINHPTVL